MSPCPKYSLYRLTDEQQFFANPNTPNYPFNSTFFFIFNVAVGGDWPGAPDGNKKEGTVEGITRRVWVREKLLVIDKHLNAVSLPGHAEDVELIIK